MRAATRLDCTGEPPGELMTRKTAERRFRPKARSSTGPVVARLMPPPKPGRAAMAPERRTSAMRGRRSKGERIMPPRDAPARAGIKPPHASIPLPWAAARGKASLAAAGQGIGMTHPEIGIYASQGLGQSSGLGVAPALVIVD